MKKRTILEIRQTVRSLLREATCPGCGDPEAHVGLNNIECPNATCKFFSQRQLDDMRDIDSVENHIDCIHCGAECDVGDDMCIACGHDPHGTSGAVSRRHEEELDDDNDEEEDLPGEDFDFVRNNYPDAADSWIDASDGTNLDKDRFWVGSDGILRGKFFTGPDVFKWDPDKQEWIEPGAT